MRALTILSESAGSHYQSRYWYRYWYCYWYRSWYCYSLLVSLLVSLPVSIFASKLMRLLVGHLLLTNSKFELPVANKP